MRAPWRLQTNKLPRLRKNIHILFRTVVMQNHITKKPDTESNCSSKCGLCGGPYPHKDQCPATGRRCLNCDKLNHFAKMCISRLASMVKPASKKNYQQPKQRARSVTTRVASQSDDEAGGCDEQYTFHIGAVYSSPALSDKPLFNIKIANTPLCVMADSGATVNIINEKDYLTLKPKPVLSPSSIKVYPYMSDKPLHLCGVFKSDISSCHETCNTTFYVAKGPSRSLISWKTSQRLKLIQVANTIYAPDILR